MKVWLVLFSGGFPENKYANIDKKMMATLILKIRVTILTRHYYLPKDICRKYYVEIKRKIICENILVKFSGMRVLLHFFLGFALTGIPVVSKKKIMINYISLSLKRIGNLFLCFKKFCGKKMSFFERYY